MRLPSLFSSRAVLVAAALSLPMAAFADTITFAPTNGSQTVTFTFDPTNPAAAQSGGYSIFESAAYGVGGSDVVASDGAPDNVLYLINPDFAASQGVGSVSVYFTSCDPNLGTTEYGLYSGPLIFTGDAGAPVLVPGTYTLTDTLSNTTATLTVDGGLAAAPEPSSLLLLGTGALGFGGVLRRRFIA